MAISDILSGIGSGLEKVGKVAGAVAEPLAKGIATEEAGYAPQIAQEKRQHAQSMEDAQLAAKEQELTAQLEIGRKYGTLTPEQQNQYVDAITKLYSNPRHAPKLMEKLRQIVHPNGATAGSNAPSQSAALPSAIPEGGTNAAEAKAKETEHLQSLTDEFQLKRKQDEQQSQDAWKFFSKYLPPEELPQIQSEWAMKNLGVASALKPLAGEAGKPFKGADGQYYIKEQGAQGLVDVPMGPNYQPPAGHAKGLSFDTATGQVVNKDTMQRFSRGDKDLPPEVSAMFQGQAGAEKRKQDLALQLAGMRGASYNDTKPLSVYDAENGNAPTYKNFKEIRANPGRYVPTGPGAKAIASENLMQDIQGTSELTRKAINNLQEDFPPEMKIKIAAAMRADDPHASLDQLIASGAVGSLAPDQQDFLIATRQLAENAMAMRSILGAGQGSEDVRDAVRQTLPALLSPDKSYATRQLNALDATISRLHRGVPRVKLNTLTEPVGGVKIIRDKNGRITGIE